MAILALNTESISGTLKGLRALPIRAHGFHLVLSRQHPWNCQSFQSQKAKTKNLQVNTTFSQSKIFNKTPIKFQNEGKTTGFLILQTVFFFQ